MKFIPHSMIIPISTIFYRVIKVFEQIILENWPRVDIVLENRYGTRYRGGNFLLSKFNDLQELVKRIEQRSLRLDLALDIPQLFTAHGGPENFSCQDLEKFMQKLKSIMHKVKSIHLWGKKRTNNGRIAPHAGDLNSYFNNDIDKKKIFLESISELLMDGTKRYFVPEVNSSSEDLQSIVRDLEEAEIEFINIDVREFFFDDPD
ncbi:MAG: hypothetical protein WHT07_12490 [Desulfobaccales bacterium]